MIQFIVFFLINMPSAFASDTDCSIEAKNCVFTGSLETHTYPGAPNYKDIKKGDEAETHLYIKLDTPITVHFKDWDKNDVPVTEKISLLQMRGDFGENLFKISRKRNHVTIDGTLFESFSGHHHTHFLIDLVKIVRDKK